MLTLSVKIEVRKNLVLSQFYNCKKNRIKKKVKEIPGVLLIISINRRTIKKIFLIVLGVLLTVNCFAFELTIPNVFLDHMVFQRDQKVPVWGTTVPNVIVAILFAEQNKSVISNENGNWRIDLDPLTASSKSRILTIKAKYNNEIETLKIIDVLVGEVGIIRFKSL